MLYLHCSILLCRVDCQKYAAEFGKPGSTFPCFYSQLDHGLVITELDSEEIYSTLLYCISIPYSIFVTAVAYLIMAGWYIYPGPAQVRYTVTLQTFSGEVMSCRSMNVHKSQANLVLDTKPNHNDRNESCNIFFFQQSNYFHYEP